ncbi:hypothetical protein COT97_00320 [Candidatus Falkowbacteria bacterium CG10_big_fil_rev_8_21_14_0_10_39_11]|uniref:NodB homology domain-containing protein n=1 Tax=Candidatus Falkowbacteria bacterium CG10_big_fil_rev_8_21_14_0_10_39_11 TaxID=1974565 RepID=A0A2H0V693_9BACT|nr:MAG: hypothetical protein COT97_00320 [Candidatus Falkowbacteria bacterium CG10_big_fil_rev_8_21_14_0_10_39_11]
MKTFRQCFLLICVALVAACNFDVPPIDVPKIEIDQPEYPDFNQLIDFWTSSQGSDSDGEIDHNQCDDGDPCTDDFFVPGFGCHCDDNGTCVDDHVLSSEADAVEPCQNGVCTFGLELNAHTGISFFKPYKANAWAYDANGMLVFVMTDDHVGVLGDTEVLPSVITMLKKFRYPAETFNVYLTGGAACSPAHNVLRFEQIPENVFLGFDRTFRPTYLGYFTQDYTYVDYMLDNYDLMVVCWYGDQDWLSDEARAIHDDSIRELINAGMDVLFVTDALRTISTTESNAPTLLHIHRLNEWLERYGVDVIPGYLESGNTQGEIIVN